MRKAIFIFLVSVSILGCSSIEKDISREIEIFHAKENRVYVNHSLIDQKNDVKLPTIDYSEIISRSQIETHFKRTGHSEDVNMISFSPDGRFFLSASENERSVYLWSIEGHFIRAFEEHGSDIESLDFSPDGLSFLCGYEDGDIIIWSLSGEQLLKITSETRSPKVAFSPDGKYIASGEWRDIRLFSISGDLIKEFRSKISNIKEIKFTPDGKNIACIGDNKYIEIWSIEDESVREIDAYFSRDIDRPVVGTIDFSPDGNFFITGDQSYLSYQNLVMLWSIEGKHIRSFRQTDKVAKVEFSPDGQEFISCTSKGLIARNLDGIITNKNNGVETFAIAPDGKSIVTGDSNGELRLLSRNMDLVYKYGSKDIFPCRDFIFCPDGKHLAYLSGNSLQIWSTNGNIINTIRDTNYSRIKYSSDGKFLLCASQNHKIEIRNIFGDLVDTFYYSESGWLKDFSINQDGNIIAIVFSNDMIIIRSLDGKEEYEIDSIENIRDLDFEGDNILLSTRRGNRYMISATGNILSKEEKDIIIDSIGTVICSDGYYLTVRHHGYGFDIFSPNNRIVYSSDEDTDEITYDYENNLFAIELSSGHIYILSSSGKVIQKIDSNLSLGNLLLSPECKFVSGCMEDGTTMIWNIETKEKITIINSEDKGWFVLGDKFRFDTSALGRENTYFVKGIQTLHPEQFWNKLYTPLLLGKFLNSENLESIDIQDIYAPLVTIYRNEPLDSPDGTISLKVNAQDQGNGIGSISIVHNGRVLGEMTRGLTVESSIDVKTYTINLVDGKNVIKGIAYDASESVYGVSEEFSINYSPEKIVKPDMYVLAIGVSKYKDTGLSLSAPSKDALEIANIFKYIADEQYGNIITTVLTDTNATKMNIIANLESIVDNSNERDAVILFLAGHGFVENGKYNFLPFEANLIDIENSCVNISIFNDFIKELPANKVAMFLDTCQSGSAVKSLGTVAMSRSIEEKREIANLAHSRGIAIFSASSATQAAYEIADIGNGIFTFSILEAINNKQDQININGKITLGKLLSEVNDITRETAYNYLKIDQSPSMYLFGDDFYIGEIK